MRRLLRLTSVLLLVAAVLWGWYIRRDHDLLSEGRSTPAPQTVVPDGPDGGIAAAIGNSSGINGQSSGSSTATVAVVMPGEEAFVLSRFSDVELDRDPDMGTPHFIRRRGGFLSPSVPDADPVNILTAFINANARTMTLHPSDLTAPNARISRDYQTAHNGLRQVVWQQEHEGVDIFGARLTINLTEDNRIVNVSSRALHFPSLIFHDKEVLTESDAIKTVREVLGGGEVRHTYTVRKVWYPLDMISCVMSWEVAIQCAGNPEAHDMVIRADTGEVVFDQSLTWGAEEKQSTDAKAMADKRNIRTPRKFNISEELGGTSSSMSMDAGDGVPPEGGFAGGGGRGVTESITLNAFTNDSPAPMTPGTDAPTNFVPAEVPRLEVTLTAMDTNASPNGWIPDGSNELLGNNANVYRDWDDDDSPDAPYVTGAVYRVFDEYLDLTDYPTNYVDFSQVQAFYWANMFHDRLYAMGFDEPSGNFQTDNFGRGGFWNDALKVEVQNGADYGFSHANKAWYQGFGDGSEGKVVISIFGRTDPHRCGALDGQLVLHEITHGLTSRLIGNGYGLTKVQSRGMAEGWSDFFALTLLSESSDRIDGCYAIGNYAAVYDDEPGLYYYGIRRFPYSTDMTKAPQTFADTDPNQIYFPPEIPRNPHFGSEEADQIHNIGEVWCLALWECRANLVEEYGFNGNGIIEQLVVDGLKLTPENPRFDQARDAILQAELVNYGGTNAIALWRGFAKRGLGYSASVPESPSTVGIEEAYDLPFTVGKTLEEWNGDGDGYIEPGEQGRMFISLTSPEMNLIGITGMLTAVSSNITMLDDTVSLPDISAGSGATSSVPFVFEVATNFPGFTDAEFTLRIATDKGWFDETVLVRIGNPYDYPPEILNVAVTNITETNAWVQWSTGIPADGQVFYGLSTNYDMSAPLMPDMQTNHIAELTNLLKGTVYHFQIVSEGTNGLTGCSTDMTFRARARIYVYSGSTATQELGTQEAPYKSLQVAAKAAKTTGDDILVAVGIYTDTQTEAVLDLDGSDYDLTIIGGYSPDFSECMPDWYPTVIDGEYQRRGIRLDNGAALDISGVTVTHGSYEWGGGVSIRASIFSARNCLIINNCSTNGGNDFGGGFYATLNSSVFLIKTEIINNRALIGGAGFCVSHGTYVQLKECTLSGNSSTLSGGIEIQLAAGISLFDTSIVSNSCDIAGGGLRIAPFSTGSVYRCSLSENTVISPSNPDRDGGGGILVGGELSVLNVNNSIIYSNYSEYGADVNCGEQSSVHAIYCNIGDIYGSLTTSNNLINANPMFANPEAGDFHLLYGSPCIDAGSPDYYGSDLDMDGEVRPFGVRVDMGADEFTDADSDHMADYWETNHFGSITVSDGSADGDVDALTDFDEYMEQTDPANDDTDGDLAGDGTEIGAGMNPLDPDEDQDAMWDGWEVQNGLDWTTNDAALNPDDDWMVNVEEFIADTDPSDDASYLGMLNVGSAYGGRRLDWKGGINSWQWLEYSTNMTDWEVVFGFPPPRPVTNAVVIFGLDDENAVFRIQAER